MKFVSEWNKKECGNKSMEWVFTDKGMLPDSDRKVLVITIFGMYGFSAERSIYTSSFTPESGWSGTSKVIAWRDLDEETKKLLSVKDN